MPKKHHVEVEGRELTISNVEKVYFPSSGFTKGQVISFYSEIAEVILPHLRDRPLTLKRFPEGIEGEHFYEKKTVQTFTTCSATIAQRSSGRRTWQISKSTLYWPLHQTSIAQRPSFSTWIPVNPRESWIAVAWRCI